MLFSTQNSWRYLIPLFAVFLWVACAQDKPGAAKDEVAPTKKEYTLGAGTKDLPIETQLQRYNAGLESMERYQSENAGKMTPEIEQELKDKIESARHKIDSLTKIANSAK